MVSWCFGPSHPRTVIIIKAKMEGGVGLIIIMHIEQIQINLSEQIVAKCNELVCTPHHYVMLNSKVCLISRVLMAVSLSVKAACDSGKW